MSAATLSRSQRRGVRAAAVVLLAACSARAQPAPQPATHIAALRSPADATDVPARLLAVVTAMAPTAGAVYAEDASGGVVLTMSAGLSAPRVGARVDAFGHTTWRGAERAFLVTRLQVVGHAALPATRARLDDVFSGAHEARRVELEGIVREVVARDGGTQLALGVGLGRLAVWLPGLQAQRAERLIDGRVRVRGVASERSGPGGTRGALRLLAASADDVELLEPGAADPFSVALLGAAQLERLALHAGRDHRVRVRGVVTRHRLGHGLYVVDGADPLYVESAQGPQLEAGDVVEVSGFPTADARATLLEGALWRRTGRVTPPAALPVAAQDVLADAHEAQLVRVEGTLLSQAREPRNDVLVLTAGGGFFNAIVASDRAGDALRALAPGSRLAVTGVAYLRRLGAGGSFDLLLRTGGDVELVSGPGWLERHAPGVALGVSLLALAALGAVFVLRQQVARQARLVQTVVAENERRLTQVVDSLSEGMLALDGEGRIVLWNAAAERLCGRARADALGHVLATAWPSLDTPALRRALDQARERGAPAAPVDVAGACAERPAAVLEARVFAFAGGLTVFLDEVSAARELVAELRRARSAAESAAQAKAAFLANMSHEMRTPLNAVIGLTGPLLGTRLDDEQRELVTTVRSSAEALLALVSGLLDFSKIDAGKLELLHAPFDLRACLEDTLRLVAERALAKGLALGCEVAPDVPAFVVGDLTRVRQVLVNLADNAVKFTQQGEVVVRVWRGASPHVLAFEVRDSGPGIPEDARARLFQPFAQLDASTTRRFGGSGLGLALCKRLVERMAGHLELRSAPGAGASFVFELELRAAPGGAPRAAAGLRGRRALLLCAGEGVRAGLVTDLRAWGLDVRASGACDDLLGWLDEDPRPDVALVDLDLESGPLRERLAARGVALVGLSRSAPPAGPPPAPAAVVRKPVRLARLDAALRKALRLNPPAIAPDTLSDVRRLAELLPLRILVAEDNPINQKVALLTLRGLGYEADLAANGLEVLRALQRQPYDVVIMDVQMPEMDGLEAARRIRATWPSNGPRILALTASAFVEDRERCRAAGMDGFVAKPLDAGDLRRALLALVDERGGDAAAAQSPLAEATGPALDARVTEDLRAVMDADGEESFGALCGLFLESGRVRLDALRDAVARGDGALAAREAHALAGSCATLGARRLAELLARFTTAPRAEHDTDARAALVEVELEFTRVEQALVALRDARKPA